jgi:hypothetical protein
MKTVKQIVHRKLGKEQAFGQADTDTGLVEIDSRLKGVEHLDTLIHEILHVQNPRWGELKVQGHATELATLLWEQGYRRIAE